MSEIDRLIEIMARLRDPEQGCPWDVEQTFSTIAPYAIEEAYEVAHAIERGDLDDLRDELGDLLLQVVFHARMAEEQGSFAFGDVVGAICEKLVRRHPHVFGDSSEGGNVRLWEQLKAEERAEKRARAEARGEAEDPLADIPRAQPALIRTGKLLSRGRSEAGSACETPGDIAAVKVVEAWLVASGASACSDDPAGPAALAAGSDAIGTLLVACVRVARAQGVDAEVLLRDANSGLEERVRRAIGAAKRAPRS